MAERQACRLQSPADDNGNRTDLHPITSVDEVIYDDNTTLREKMEDIAEVVVVSEVKPDHSCLWVKPVHDQNS